MLNKLTYINASLNKLRNNDVMGGAKCTARTARLRTPLLYTTHYIPVSYMTGRQIESSSVASPAILPRFANIFVFIARESNLFLKNK